MAEASEIKMARTGSDELAGGHMSRRSILTALLVAHAALFPGCGVWNLTYVPGDLIRARERGPDFTPRTHRVSPERRRGPAPLALNPCFVPGADDPTRWPAFGRLAQSSFARSRTDDLLITRTRRHRGRSMTCALDAAGSGRARQRPAAETALWAQAAPGRQRTAGSTEKGRGARATCQHPKLIDSGGAAARGAPECW